MISSKFRIAACGLLLLVMAVPVTAQESAGAHDATPRAAAAPVEGSITLDGRLDEAAWAAATPATDFRQQEPTEGEPATQRTEIRFLYDESALYIGARMYDTEGAAGVRTRLSRRDQIEGGDNLLFVFDTFHDHVGRTMFQVNPSGVKFDAGQAAAFADPAWDGIWEVETAIDAEGWVAEIRIPFSQLRYPTTPVQTWGMQVWRWTERVAERSMWTFWRMQESGGPQRFGHLENIQVPASRIGLEVMPYVVGKAEHLQETDTANPFHEPTDYAWRVGGDVKAVLSSTFTLDLTVNPDFGQVEVDPAVVNLSQFETFFPERRPFFVEGSGLFGFGSFSCMICSNASSMSLFYSRRVGRSPQGRVNGDAAYVDIPGNTTILGAAKLTGRMQNGLQVGVMNALTGAAEADAVSPAGERFEQEVEPLTNYFVGRVRQNLRGGNLTIGGIATSVIRSFENGLLRDIMPSSAVALGTDWQLRWANQTYSLMGNVAFTQVDGEAVAIDRLQRAPQRYFQRPDREHGGNGFLSNAYDPTQTTMRGLGGYTRLAREQGDLIWETQVNWRTPGFEANDLAYLTRADYLWMNANAMKRWSTPTSVYRRADFGLGGQQQFNFDGDLTDQQVHMFAGMQTANYWWTSVFAQYRPEVYDDRLTRGGMVVRRAASWNVNPSFNSDSRKKFWFRVHPGYGSTADGGRNYNLMTGIEYRAASNVSLSIGPYYSFNQSKTQFVRSFADPTATAFDGVRTVFSDIEQHTVGMDTRVRATFTPTVSLELFMQPFMASGDYSNFKEFTQPRTVEKRVFDDSQVTELRNSQDRVTGYALDPDRDDATGNFTLPNPDFNFRSLRGNAVLRWEYRPGSTMFFVWQQQRAGSERYGDFDFTRDTGAIFDGQPDNIFLVKVSYWLGR